MNKKKKIYCAIGLAALLTLCAVFIAAQTPVTDQSRAARYVRSLGWETTGAAEEKVQLEIPRVFDQVYENYNGLQKQAGFDLLPYRGEKVTRFTFRVLNFDGAPEVRANVLVYKSKIIGGDLMTVAIDGFMLPLQKR